MDPRKARVVGNAGSVIYNCTTKAEIDTDDSDQPIKFTGYLSDEHDAKTVAAILANEFDCGYGWIGSDRGVEFSNDKVVIFRDKVADSTDFTLLIQVLLTMSGF